MVIKFADKDLYEIQDLLTKNNIEFKLDMSAYLMALKEDIEETWYSNQDEEPPERLLEDVLYEMINDDNAYAQYDECIDEHIQKFLKEYNKE